ncbi:hypothetical protein NBRC10513v2_003284 [Rhodotorula toruloides]
MLSRSLFLALASAYIAYALPADSTVDTELVERQYGGFGGYSGGFGGFGGSSSGSSTTGCATGVHIIVARASTEAAGEGIIGQVATQVKNQIPGSSSEAISYPATLYNYLASESAGVAAMTAAIQSYTQRCPDSKIVLMGYSQGAQVVGDSLCGSSGLYGGGGHSFPSGFSYPSSPYIFSGFKRSSMPSELATESPVAKRSVEERQLPSDETKNIVAVIQMGDPTFVPGKSYDVGTSVTRGLFPRSNTACFDQFASRIQSYCDAGDEFCASGASLAVHLSYVTKYGSQATQFVVNKARA